MAVKQTAILNDRQVLKLLRQTERKIDRQEDRYTAYSKCQAESQAGIQCRHSRQRAIHCHSMQCVRKRQGEGKKAETDRKKEHPCVCSFWRISLHLHPPQSSPCTKKNRPGGRGLLLERKYRLGREAGRETEGESRCRKSSPSSACHLLLYVLSSSGKVIGFLMPAFLCS